ncbi:MAG: replication initiation protein [Prevotellaceae bacterium]|jgi:plasmid replication initiation protein|nr:replication initiation protein [Prevotellaceae bacterium]
MEDHLSIIQPNAITNARYEYTQMQKDIMYYVIEALQNKMTRQRDIWGSITVELNLRNFVAQNQYTRVMTALKDLGKRQLSYNFNRNDKTYDVTTTIIASVVSERYGRRVQLRITDEALPLLLFLGEGFTAYNMNVALTLNSLYAKRMYEICCRWKDKGFYRVHLDELRKMLCIEKKYLQVVELRKNVLDLSQEMLKANADLTFTYQLKKESSRSFNWLEMWICQKGEDPRSKNDQKYFETVYNFLYEFFRNSKAADAVNVIQENGQLKRAADRLTRLEDDIRKGKIKKKGQRQYISKVLTDEFKIPVHIMGIGSKRQQEKSTEEERNKKIEGMKDNPIFQAVMEQEKKKRLDQKKVNHPEVDICSAEYKEAEEMVRLASNDAKAMEKIFRQAEDNQALRDVLKKQKRMTPSMIIALQEINRKDEIRKKVEIDVTKKTLQRIANGGDKRSRSKEIKSLATIIGEA